ncbi:MAG: hypothetical protein KDE53_41030, partial [Caldilineaceae bacterium]|nr:hypothetical protein [Caldilineaceae bacterium]
MSIDVRGVPYAAKLEPENELRVADACGVAFHGGYGVIRQVSSDAAIDNRNRGPRTEFNVKRRYSIAQRGKDSLTLYVSMIIPTNCAWTAVESVIMVSAYDDGNRVEWVVLYGDAHYGTSYGTSGEIELPNQSIIVTLILHRWSWTFPLCARL